MAKCIFALHTAVIREPLNSSDFTLTGIVLLCAMSLHVNTNTDSAVCAKQSEIMTKDSFMMTGLSQVLSGACRTKNNGCSSLALLSSWYFLSHSVVSMEYFHGSPSQPAE